jgi:preprotein translocase subunit SecY
MLKDPIHTVFFVAVFGFICVNVSRLWIDISGNNAKDVAQQFS